MEREYCVEEFMEAMGQPVNTKFQTDILMLRLTLIDEEAKEVRAAGDTLLAKLLNKKEPSVDEKAQFLKELCDLQYVLSGMAMTFGLPLKAAMLAVHDSNMTKLGDDGKPVYREDGKVMKGANYRPPDMTKFIRS